MKMKDQKRPNIVFILSDDQGAWAARYAGNKHIITPNLDQLANSGMTFSNSFCASPVCSPARATILTGKMPSQHGVQDWIRKGHYGEEAIDYLRGQLTFPELLSKVGYECAISGKWHLGDVHAVKNRFPDHTYVHLKGAGHYYNAPMVKNGELIEEPGYVTDCITDDAIGYLNDVAQRGAPFYLSVHYTAPHNPWIDGEHPEEIVKLYEDCSFDDIPQGFIREDAIYRYDEQDARECLKGYYAAITAMDQNIGRIIAELDKLGLRENTLVIFTSDNGFNCGHHGVWGKGNATKSLNMFDTSIKVPLIINQPGFIKPSNAEAMVSQYDYFHMILEYLGIANPYKNGLLPGKSFLPLLKGEKMQEHESLVVYDEYGPVRMIRTKEWKYVHRYETGMHELYCLTEDPNEESNLFDLPEMEAKVTELRSQLCNWFRHYTDEKFDGSVQTVRGNGQINALNLLKEGEIAFDLNRQATTDPKGDPSIKAGSIVIAPQADR
ncbi:sulfatase-like hydrolase/transferase [Sporomusa aerivorans]|uniref:sulfatase-like hydrolase/transferase n=1 Tax=Sporomusa aerivorans TaxID=204936 RepID=UPI00352A95EF